MKFFAFIALASAIQISNEDYPAASPLIIDAAWKDYPYKNVQRQQITNPAFTGDAALDYNLSKEPSCPSYMKGYNCKNWATGKVTGLVTQERPHTELSGK